MNIALKISYVFRTLRPMAFLTAQQDFTDLQDMVPNYRNTVKSFV